jgi:hypothetical protein
MAKTKRTPKRPEKKATDELAGSAVALCIGIDQHRRSLLMMTYGWEGMLKLAKSLKVPPDDLESFMEPMADALNDAYGKACHLSRLAVEVPMGIPWPAVYPKPAGRRS